MQTGLPCVFLHRSAAAPPSSAEVYGLVKWPKVQRGGPRRVTEPWGFTGHLEEGKKVIAPLIDVSISSKIL